MANKRSIIITDGHSGYTPYEFKLNNDKSHVEISNHFIKNDATDIFLEIHISEWEQVVKYINSQING